MFDATMPNRQPIQTMTAQKTSVKTKLGIGLAALALAGGLGGSTGLMAAGLGKVIESRPAAGPTPVVRITKPTNNQVVTGGFDFTVLVSAKQEVVAPTSREPLPIAVSLNGTITLSIDNRVVATKQVQGNPITFTYAVPVDLILPGMHTLSAKFTNQIGTQFGAQNITITFEPVTPHAPTNLNVSEITGGLGLKHKLTWNDNSSNEERFEIERSITTIGQAELHFVQLDFTQPDTIEQEYSVTEPGKQYVYRVRACDIVHVCSAYSNEASIVTPPMGTFFLSDATSTPSGILVVVPNVWHDIWTPRVGGSGESHFKIKSLHLKNYITDVPAADGRFQSFGLFEGSVNLQTTAMMVGGTVNFEFNPQALFLISANNAGALHIKAKLQTITDATKSGGAIRLGVNKQSAGTTQGVNVISELYNLPITNVVITDQLSGVNVLRKTKPTITRFGTPAGSFQSGSDKVIYRFTVSADQNDNVAWKGVKFDVTGQFGSLALSTTTPFGIGAGSSFPVVPNVSNARLYEYGTNQEVQNGAYIVVYGLDHHNNNAELAIVMNNGVEEIVAHDQSKTYELRATIDGVAQNSDFLDVRIDDESNDAVAQGASRIVTTDPNRVDNINDEFISMLSSWSPMYHSYSFLWSDMSGAPHSAANQNAVAGSRDWTNDYLVPIDTSSWTHTAVGF